MNVNGTSQTRMTNDPGGDFDPRFKPNGSQIVFTSDRDGDEEIWIMAAIPLSPPTQLTSNTGFNDNFPEFNPNGTVIVFTSDRDVDTEVYVMNASGTGQTNLSQNSAEDSHGRFGKNGDIVFDSNRNGDYDLFTMDIQGNGQVAVENRTGDQTVPHWGLP